VTATCFHPARSIFVPLLDKNRKVLRTSGDPPVTALL
jgi:hypothetical protein